MSTDALGTAGGFVSAAEHRLALSATLAGLSTGILDARTGVFPGPNSTALITGTSATGTMTVNVAAFQAATSRTSAQGVYLGPTFESGVTALAIAAAPASNSRIDVVYVKQQDADATVVSPDASTAPLVAVVTGTAAASPVKPSIPVGALELGTVTVASTATSTNGAGVTIANTVRQTVARGGIIPALAGETTPGAYDGQWRDNAVSGVLERWSAGLSGWFAPPAPTVPDTGWVTITPGTGLSLVPTTGVAQDFSIRTRNGISHLHIRLNGNLSSGATIGTITNASQRPVRDAYFVVNAYSNTPIDIRVQASGVINTQQSWSTGGILADVVWITG